MNCGKHSRILGSQRGSLLMLTMLTVMLLAVMSIGVLSVTTNALHLSRMRGYQAEAFNIAESGAEMAALWLQAQSYPPAYSQPFDPFSGPQTLGDGTYSVTIYPDAGNGTAYLKIYQVVSTGTVHGTTKKVEIVFRQASFGRFAYFTDREVSSISGGTIWWKAGETCDGPAHSNNTGNSPFSINYNGSAAPIFLDAVTASGSYISYDPSRPRNEATFRRIFADGSKGFKLGVPRIELPDSTDAQRNAAWGASSGFPGSDGVYLRSDYGGGIYIRGDSAIQLSGGTAGVQRIIVTQGTGATTITVDLGAGTTTVENPDGSTSTVGSVPNGVIYSTGNITSLSGEITDNVVAFDEIQRRSAWTIATDVNASKDITVGGNLYYHTRPDKTKDTDDPLNLAAGTLGLVAHNVKIASSAPKNLEIDAVCLAGGRNTSDGSFYVTNYSTKTPVGTLKVIGGIIQKARGPVGTFNPSTGQTTSGYAKSYSYDPRLAVYPPPYYPTTGTFDRLSWRVLPD